MTGEELLASAVDARANAYAPYSHFYVGAALLTKDGRVFSGCNIENASFGVTCCAERVALFSAVAAGAREFSALAVVGKGDGSGEEFCPPCGVCRQALLEFCNQDLPIYLSDGKKMRTCHLGELLPLSFSAEQLGKKD